MDSLEELLPKADIVAMSLPGNASTYHVLSRERIALLSDNAVVLNVGRGTAIDTDALADALYAGKIAGAALDVTDPEPLPADHRLWNAPNLLFPEVFPFRRRWKRSSDCLQTIWNGILQGSRLKIL